MTLLHPARAARAAGPRLSSLKRRPETVAAITGVGAFLVQLIAGWPGWMLPVSLGQLAQARSGPFTDSYPAVLTWLWAQTDPSGRGALVPFLLQVSLFWLGVVLLTVGVQPAPAWTRFIPLAVLLNPLAWVIVAVVPASTVLAVVSAAVGLASVALRLFRSGRPTDGTVALLMAAVVMGFGALGGGILTVFLLPLLMLLTAALVLAVLPHHLPARMRFETGAKAVILTGAAGLVAAVALPLIVIGNVAPTRTSESFYALDAFHVDCAGAWSTGQVAADPVSPQGLWRDGSAPCAAGKPGDFGDAWAGAADPGSAQVLHFGGWFDLALHNPGVVVGGRLQHATAMLLTDYTLIPDITGGELVAAPAAVGAGANAGQPNRGGLLLSVAAAATALLPAAPLLWTLVIPAGVAIWLVRRRRPVSRAGHEVTMLPLLLWPPLAALVLGMATPFNDATVIAPAAALGWVFALWAVATAGVRMEARDVEGVRYGGPYPGTPAPAQTQDPDAVPARRARLSFRRRLRGRRLPNLPSLRRRRMPQDDPAPVFVGQYHDDLEAELHEEVREKVPH